MLGKLAPIGISIATVLATFAFSYGSNSAAQADQKVKVDQLDTRLRSVEQTTAGINARLDDIKSTEQEINRKLDGMK